MPPLHKKWFRQESDIDLDLAKTVAARDITAVHTVLNRINWHGERGAGVAVELSADNRHVARAQFFMRGVLSAQPGTFAASKMWERADKAVNVSITFPSGDAFNFSNGSLASDYVPGEAVKIACSKNGEVVLPTDYAAHGIGELTLRLIAYLDKGSNTAAGPRVKFTVLGYPATEEQMFDMSDLAADIGWPGIKLLEGQADFVPPPPQEGWGCPMLPVILPAADLTAVPNVPSGAELRYAVAKVMATARLPVPCTAVGPLMKRWAKLEEDPNSMEDRLPTVSWPVPPRHQIPTSGKNNIFPLWVWWAGGKRGGE